MSEFTFEEVSPESGRRQVVGDGTTVGREGCDVSLADDPEVSRRHAAFRRIGLEIAVEDLGSSNGTFVNDRRISAPMSLTPGDTVRFGDTVWRLDGTPAAETIVRRRAPEPSLSEPTSTPAPPRPPKPPTKEPEPPPPAAPAPRPQAAAGPAEALSAVGADAPAGRSRGDVPIPPDLRASAVHPAPARDPGSEPVFEGAGEAPRRRSAARSGVATGVAFAVILATAIALAIHFAAT